MTHTTKALVVAALLGTGMLTAACGSQSSTTARSGAPSASTVSLENRALAYTDCMRTHGEPAMPDPTFNGRQATLDITPSSGVDPSSPRFTAATDACQYRVPHGGVARRGLAITRAQQADYRKGVACMRSHGFPRFPEPVFHDDTVTFHAAGTRIDTNPSRFTRALTTCEKLIPAGLPDSSPDGP